MQLLDDYKIGNATAVDVFEALQEWKGYAVMGNTHALRKTLKRTAETELQRRTELR